MNILDRLCEYVFGNEKRRINFLCMYVVLFLACFACMLYTAYQAVSCFPDKTFWIYVMLTVWFVIPTVLSYVVLQFFSVALARYNEQLWREHDQLKKENK
jgi:hypothetical protein